MLPNDWEKWQQGIFITTTINVWKWAKFVWSICITFIHMWLFELSRNTLRNNWKKYLGKFLKTSGGASWNEASQ